MQRVLSIRATCLAVLVLANSDVSRSEEPLPARVRVQVSVEVQGVVRSSKEGIVIETEEQHPIFAPIIPGVQGPEDPGAPATETRKVNWRVDVESSAVQGNGWKEVEGKRVTLIGTAELHQVGRTFRTSKGDRIDLPVWEVDRLLRSAKLPVSSQSGR